MYRRNTGETVLWLLVCRRQQLLPPEVIMRVCDYLWDVKENPFVVHPQIWTSEQKMDFRQLLTRRRLITNADNNGIHFFVCGVVASFLICKRNIKCCIHANSSSLRHELMYRILSWLELPDAAYSQKNEERFRIADTQNELAVKPTGRTIEKCHLLIILYGSTKPFLDMAPYMLEVLRNL